MRVDEQDWQDLEAERHRRGVVSRRLYPASQRDLFIAIDQVTGQRMLVIRTSSSHAMAALRRFRAFPRTRGLHLEFVGLTDGQRELRIALMTADLREVFNPLLTDIADAAQAAPDDTEALVAAVQRFDHWRNLLQTIGDTGLSKESRRGLYGELRVLREHILLALSPVEALRSWTGPLLANQDFQVNRCAIEVKTTSARGPQSLQIASERQLDETGVEHLFLVHLSVDERQGGNGESLNAAVESVRRPFDAFGLATQFDELLMRIGFFSHQRHLYDDPRYTVRAEHLWSVQDDFPRITETDLRPGVGDCQYRITTTGLERFEVSPEQLAVTLGTPHA
ncbi:PD-(D/E)XK motif protein [Saccharothrix sp. S26]|uniref:PD-(D/E)XK motif protein n=1 Tax=Saccharothrix sp. S26 TaxID=2907215 RepID=UPI001F3FC305|nr:PD-(D/E)XK motif protein [Saccharothrix sp. S26]MCE6999975.1 PD-(D/E)XK motif protein [Saccharothrix sp. S26]